MDYSGSGTNQEIDDDEGSVLPGCVPYLSLVFKMITTTVILLLSGWVVYTIKTTRRLHKPHNIFVANLLISGMITTLTGFLIASTVMVSFQLGVEPFITCIAVKLRLLPSLANNFSLAVIAGDKLLAMVYIRTFPFKYKKIMTPRLVAGIVSSVWLLAIVPTVYAVAFNTDGYVMVPKYGACLANDNAFLEVVFVFVIPITVTPILTISLNLIIALKAYQAHQQIVYLQEDNTGSEMMKSLRQLQCNIRQNMKPVITLLVVVVSGVSLNLLFIIVYLLGRFLVDSQVYHEFMEYVIRPNSGYVFRFLQPLVYGLYFKQVREPMMACLKRFVRKNKVNSVAPQP